MTTEFIDFAEKQRKDFSRNIASSFCNRFTVDERVEIENILIAYDQLVSHLKEHHKRLIESLGEATPDNEYTLKPDENGEWWLTHKHVGSGEPFEQFLNSETIKP